MIESCPVCSYVHGHEGHTEPDCSTCDEYYAGVSNIRIEDEGDGMSVIHYTDSEGRSCAVGCCTPEELADFKRKYCGGGDE